MCRNPWLTLLKKHLKTYRHEHRKGGGGAYQAPKKWKTKSKYTEGRGIRTSVGWREEAIVRFNELQKLVWEDRKSKQGRDLEKAILSKFMEERQAEKCKLNVVDENPAKRVKIECEWYDKNYEPMESDDESGDEISPVVVARV